MKKTKIIRWVLMIHKQYVISLEGPKNWAGCGLSLSPYFAEAVLFQTRKLAREGRLHVAEHLRRRLVPVKVEIVIHSDVVGK